MNERVRAFLKRPEVVPALIGVTAFAAGAGLGYILTRRKVTVVPSVPVGKITNISIDEEGIQVSGKLDPTAPNFKATKDMLHPPTNLSVGGDVPRDVVTYIPHQPPPAPDLEPVTQSIFPDEDDDWDYEKEEELRKVSGPYIIHKDEYWAEEKGYQQHTLTYYAGDDIMADENDVPIYGHVKLFGDLKFGHGSGDPNVVYVRNDERRGEYEILRDPQAFAIVVQGLEADAETDQLKHSEGPLRFRLDD